MNPIFSVIVTFFNQKNFFEETLHSIISQNENDVEIIIVNDGSREEDSIWLNGVTQNIDFVFVINQVNLGPGSARNNGINNAKGEYIIFLDGDDLMEEGCLLAFKRAIKSNPCNDVFIGDCKYFGVKNELKKQYIPSFPQLLAYNTLIICAAIKRSFLGDNLRFETSMDRIGLEDWEFWISIVARDPKFHYIPKTLFKIRTSEFSRTTVIANRKKEKAFSIIYSKHAVLIRSHIEGLFIEGRALRSSLNTRIGNAVLAPYRALKKFFRE